MKLTLLFFAGLLLLPMLMAGREISVDEALSIALDWQENNQQLISETYEISKVSQNQGVVFFIVNFEHSFAIVSGDNLHLPILAYSFEESFPVREGEYELSELDFLPQTGLLSEYASSIAQTKSKNYSEITTRKWDEVTNSSGRSVAPFSEALWGQGYPFNMLCPLLDGQGTCVHCGATAMAILMHHYKHPVRGYGENSYIWNGETLYANFGAAVYDWSIMPGNIAEASLSGLQEIAEISYHCGIATFVDYGLEYSVSPANWQQVMIDAFSNNFGYNTDDNWVSKNSYDYQVWSEMIKEQIDQSMPVLYMSTGSGGHFFILDGYNESEYFHVNWGWEGAGNGYYTLDNMTPFGIDFNVSQKALLNIHPNWTSTPFFYCETQEINLSLLPDVSQAYEFSFTNFSENDYFYEVEFSTQENWITAISPVQGIIEVMESMTFEISLNTQNTLPGSELHTTIQFYTGNGLAMTLPVNINITSTATGDEFQSTRDIEMTLSPNPCNLNNSKTDGLQINFRLPEENLVRCAIYNLKGEKVWSIEKFIKNTEEHSFIWNGQSSEGADCGTGIYLCKLTSGKNSSGKKLILLK